MNKILFLFIWLIPCSVFGQKWYEELLKTNPDSVYYETLKNCLDVKVYTSRKYSNFTIDDSKTRMSLIYKSNSTRSLGIGGSYKWLGFSLGYGFDFLNKSRMNRGKSSFFDFQTQIILPTTTLKIFSGFYRGFYLSNASETLEHFNAGDFYIRNDIHASSFGIVGNYYLNHTRYSNKAVFGYSEWQKKSSGSFLVGGSVYINTIRGDSAFTPADIVNPLFMSGKKISRSQYFAYGGDGGYAFTLVIHKNWFCNLMFSTGLSYGTTNVEVVGKGNERNNYIDLNFQTTAGLGYNSKSLYVGLSQYFYSAYSPLADDNTSVGMQNGRTQFMVAYRFPIEKDYDLIPPSLRNWWETKKANK